MSDTIARNPTSLEAYQRLCQTFELEQPTHYNFGFDVVDRWARLAPQHPALRWAGGDGSERTISFQQLSRRTNQVADALLKMGLRPGDQVLVCLPNVVEWWELMTGLAKAGMIAIPTTTQLTAKDIAYRLKAAEVDALVTDDGGARKCQEIHADLPERLFRIRVGGEPIDGWRDFEALVASGSQDPELPKTRSEQPSLIYFTSGTTGPPKMVVHTHASYAIGHQLTARFWLGLSRDDLHWNLSDTGWAKTAYSGYFAPWIAGCTIFVHGRRGKFAVADVLKYLTDYPITSLCAPPTIYRMLVQQDLTGFKPAALQRCMAAGEPLNPSVFRDWYRATGLRIREGYGQTETAILCASVPDLNIRPGSMGLPVPGMNVDVIDEQGDPMPIGEPGDIAVSVEPQRPVGLFHGYWKDPDATARCYRKGWYLTGDCAYRDEDGYFWFVSRADDIITSSAYRIGPFEVESALMHHPAVAEVAVVGKPHPERTEIVKAFIVLADGFHPCDELKRELQEFVKGETAPYKYPREIEFLTELPKTVSEKVRRNELRRRA